MEGLGRYKAEGLGTAPQQVLEATRDARSEFSDLDRFINERCITEGAVRVRREELYNHYRDWCLRWDIPENDRLNGKAFGLAIKARGYTDRRLRADGDNVWWYVGIGVQEHLSAVQ